MAVLPVSGVDGINLSQLAEAYRQLITGGSASSGAIDPATVTRAGALGGVDPGAAARGIDFARLIGDGLTRVDSLDRMASSKAVQAATGDLTDIHDYVIAATAAQTATELTTALRNKALESFNEIMRMPL